MSNTREIIREHSHPPQLPTLTWTDRLALHVGLRLIRWADHTDRVTPSVSPDRFSTVETRRELTEATHRFTMVG